MAKKSGKKNKSTPAPAPAAAPARKSDSNVLVIGATVIGLMALVAWLGSGNSPAPTSSHPPPHGGHHSPPPPTGPIDPHSRLLHPEQLTEQAPATFAVQMHTSAGDFVIDVTRAWSPNGADRFYNLVRAGYFTDVAFFRVIPGFMAQAGIHGRPGISHAWHDATIEDDPVVQHNTRGFVSFATAGPNTRTTQFFVNFADNSRLDASGFSPFGHVRDMTAVDRLESRFGEGAPNGIGPDQARIQREGNGYLRASFDGLDYILTARVL